MKATKVNALSAVYVGWDINRKVNGIGKIGETAQTLKEREHDIRKGEKGYRMQACIYLFNATQAQRRYIESYIRMKMEKFATNVGNDHFSFKLKKGYKNLQYTAFAIIAMAYAIECCEKEDFKYYFTWVK